MVAPTHARHFGRLVAAALLLAGAPARAVVLHEGSAQPPPAERPLDAVVGQWSTNASLVVIGPDYAITTRHQGGGVGTTVVIANTQYRVADAFNHGLADLRVVRLETLGGAPASLADYADVYSGSDEAGQTMTVGGFGRIGDATLTQTVPPYYPYGYSWKPNAEVNWGCNTVNGSGPAAGSDYTSAVLWADFDAAVVYGDEDPDNERGWVPFEASLAIADSGGGWFVQTAGQWQVIALNRAVERLNESRFRNPANGTLDPDYMDAVRVSAYAAWISAVLGRGTWEGDASSAWADAANWAANQVPGGPDAWAVFGALGAGASYTIALTDARTVGTLRFAGAAGYAVTASGSGELLFDVTRDVAVIEASAGAHTISAPITLGDPLRVIQNSGGAFTFAGPVGGPGGLIKSGSGLLVLGADNTFSGDITLEAGTLRVTHAGGLAGGAVELRGGVLDLRGDTGTDFASDVLVSRDAGINVDSAGSGTGQTHSLGSLTLDSATLTITGSNGYDLAFYGDIVLGSSPYLTATIDTETADLTLAGPLTLTGTIIKTGPGTLTLTDGGTALDDLGPGLADPASWLDASAAGPWDAPPTGTWPESPGDAAGAPTGAGVVPEPAAWALLAAGAALLAARRRRTAPRWGRAGGGRPPSTHRRSAHCLTWSGRRKIIPGIISAEHPRGSFGGNDSGNNFPPLPGTL